MRGSGRHSAPLPLTDIASQSGLSALRLLIPPRFPLAYHGGAQGVAHSALNDIRCAGFGNQCTVTVIQGYEVWIIADGPFG